MSNVKSMPKIPMTRKFKVQREKLKVMQSNNIMQDNSIKSRTDSRRRAYIYALRVIQFIDSLNRRDLSTQVISKQLLRSATSIGANIIEAQAGRSKKDFANFFTHALKSANETKFWLGLLRDAHKADKAKTNELLQETTELANILGASVLTIRSRR